MNKVQAASLLGLQGEIDSKAIQNAFRHRAKRVHPDIMGGSDDKLRHLIMARDNLMSELSHSVQPVIFVNHITTRECDSLTISLDQALFGGFWPEPYQTGQAPSFYLPKGLRNGDLITPEGFSHPYNIKISCDEHTSVIGDDIWMIIEVDQQTLFWGGEINIDTAHGPQSARIAKQTSSGSCLCFKELGLPKTDTREQGRLYIRLVAQWPKPIPAHERLQAFTKKWA